MTDRTCWRCGQPADYWEGVEGGMKPGCYGCLKQAQEPTSEGKEIDSSIRLFIQQARMSGRDVVEVTFDSRWDGGKLTTTIITLDELEAIYPPVDGGQTQ